MKSSITVRLDEELSQKLSEVAEAHGKSRSEIIRQALRRQIAVLRFEDLRERMMPFAEARGYLTDEDIYEDIS